MASLYPLPNYTDPANRYNYVYSVLEPINRLEMMTRFDWNISSSTKAYIRMARDNENVENPRGDVVGLGQLELADTRSWAATGPLVFAATSFRCSARRLTNEILVTFSRLTLDNCVSRSVQNPEGCAGRRLRGLLRRIRAPTCRSITCHSWGGGQLGDYWPGRQRPVRAQ